MERGEIVIITLSCLLRNHLLLGRAGKAKLPLNLSLVDDVTFPPNMICFAPQFCYRKRRSKGLR